MASQTNTTTDHDEIRRWVGEHDGKPATVKGTGDDEEAGVLRIDFPGGTGADRLEQIVFMEHPDVPQHWRSRAAG